MFFSSYCDIWQQQHGLQGLFVAPGGWCGLLRAGGLITVLRKASPAEALQQESSAAALGEVLLASGLDCAALCFALLSAFTWYDACPGWPDCGMTPAAAAAAGVDM
jgi:hypothetical protein